MAKIYGINGVITGKLGAAVYAVRNGEQISRQYQPVVANPNTSGQIAARAKLKLVSQLSAVMGPYVAMRREGTITRRNMFVKVNYPTTTFSDNTADIDLVNVKLTKGVVSFPHIGATREGTTISVGINVSSAQNFDRVVYVMFERQSDNTIRHVADEVVTASSDNPTFAATMTLPAQNSVVVVYGYGLRDNTNASRVVFSNLSVPTSEMIANIIASRTLLESDVTLSETRAVISSGQA